MTSIKAVDAEFDRTEITREALLDGAGPRAPAACAAVRVRNYGGSS